MSVLAREKKWELQFKVYRFNFIGMHMFFFCSWSSSYFELCGMLVPALSERVSHASRTFEHMGQEQFVSNLPRCDIVEFVIW